jgi:aldehyde dehydrogenase (NAD+)
MMGFRVPAELERTLFIGGEFVSSASGAVDAILDPSTEEPIGESCRGGRVEVEAAVAAARNAFDSGEWAHMTPAGRVAALTRMYDSLTRRADSICALIVAEAGAVASNARARQFDIPMKHFRRFLELGLRDPVRALPPELSPDSKGGTVVGTAFVVREPVGVVAAITPYNYPYFLNLAKVVPALIAGNTVVLKPSPYTPFQALVLGEAAREAGLPPGVFNVVPGDREAGNTLVTDPRVDMVSFTGSDEVGARIAAQCAPTLKRVILELGGKSALIVRADANKNMALAQALRGFTSHAGQGCAMNTRTLVHRSLYEPFVEALAAMATKVRVGATADAGTEMGPLIRAVARERVESYVESALASGARLRAGGRRPAHLSRGFFYEPTLFDCVDPDSPIVQDEIFGPVGVVLPFADDDEAVALANRSRYGLRGGIVSADVGAAYRMAQLIRTGGLTLNGGAGTQLSDGPFGGIKRSGYGRELGLDGIDEFTNQKLIEIQAG